jgi:spore photoproduct lyase
MFSAIYIEEEVAQSERVKNILASYDAVPHIYCQRYGEVFNRKSQSFRAQKAAPALILARKHGNFVLPSPEGYGFDNNPSYYFSHMLNCIYDCRYCFLQGMYRSANYVLFVNYEDFERSLLDVVKKNDGPSVFYSGYDCDSLALEPVSRFGEYFLPFFAANPRAVLEVRTKSTQIRSFLESEPLDNCVIAMSFSPQSASEKWENRVPSIAKRIEALCKLQQAGWKIALRFEPIISANDTVTSYTELFRQIFSKLDGDQIHSASTGLFRMPVDFHKNIVKQYPDEELFSRKTEVKDGMLALKVVDEESQLEKIERSLKEFISVDQYYHCA